MNPTPPIEYPPLHPPKPEDDITQSFYWDCFTAEEQQMLIDFPVEDSAPEIALLRTEIHAALKAQQKHPATTLDESRNTLYTISVAARTVATLVKIQRNYKKTHNKWDKIFKEGLHIMRIRTGIYRQVAALGIAVPDGVLEIEPDLNPPCPLLPGWVPPTSLQGDVNSETDQPSLIN